MNKIYSLLLLLALTSMHVAAQPTSCEEMLGGAKCSDIPEDVGVFKLCCLAGTGQKPRAKGPSTMQKILKALQKVAAEEKKQLDLPPECFTGQEGKGDGKRWICSHKITKDHELYNKCHCFNFEDGEDLGESLKIEERLKGKSSLEKINKALDKDSGKVNVNKDQ